VGRQEFLLSLVFAARLVRGWLVLVWLAVDQLAGRVPLHGDHALHSAGRLGLGLGPFRLENGQRLGLRIISNDNIRLIKFALKVFKTWRFIEPGGKLFAYNLVSFRVSVILIGMFEVVNL